MHAKESPIYALDSVPFLATGYGPARKLYAVQRPFLEKRLAAEGLTMLYSVPWPPQGIYAKREIRSIEDLEGLKFRTYNSVTRASPRWPRLSRFKSRFRISPRHSHRDAST